jgi:hypothetical protein
MIVNFLLVSWLVTTVIIGSNMLSPAANCSCKFLGLLNYLSIISFKVLKKLRDGERLVSIEICRVVIEN